MATGRRAGSSVCRFPRRESLHICSSGTRVGRQGAARTCPEYMRGVQATRPKLAQTERQREGSGGSHQLHPHAPRQVQRTDLLIDLVGQGAPHRHHDAWGGPAVHARQGEHGASVRPRWAAVSCGSGDADAQRGQEWSLIEGAM